MESRIEKIAFEELGALPAELQGQTDIRYGVLVLFSTQAAFIVPAFFNKDFYPDLQQNFASTVLFFPQQTRLLSQETRPKTGKYVYLVRYCPGPHVRNERTGLPQPSAAPGLPVQVLTRYVKKHLMSIRFSEREVILEKEQVPDPAAKASAQTGKDLQQDKRPAPEVLAALRRELDQAIARKGCYYTSEFPESFRRAGGGNYKDYCRSVEDFAARWLSPDYVFRKNVVIDGKTHPGLLLPAQDQKQPQAQVKEPAAQVQAGQEPQPEVQGQAGQEQQPEVQGQAGQELQPEAQEQVGQEQIRQEHQSDPLEEAQALYEREDYSGFLSSRYVKETVAADLSDEKLEQILQAAEYLLHADSPRQIRMNAFEKAVIQAPASADFARKWKQGAGYVPEIIDSCAESSVSAFAMPSERGRVIPMLNQIGYSGTSRRDWPALTRRFSCSADRILPHLYLVRALTAEGPASAGKVIVEFIQTVKQLLAQPWYGDVRKEDRLLSFTEFLLALDRGGRKLSGLDIMVRTNIASVYTDSGDMQTLAALQPLLDSSRQQPIRRLTDFYFHYQDCSREDIIFLINGGVSLRLFQKTTALIWDGFAGEHDLPMHFLRLLNLICLEDSHGSMDEIIRFSLTGDSLNRMQKQKQLLDCFGRVCSCARQDLSMHALASYIRSAIYINVADSAAARAVSSDFDSWAEYSHDIYEAADGQFGQITKDNEAAFLRLLRIFSRDIPHLLLLEEKYAVWYRREHPLSLISTESIPQVLQELFSQGAYQACADLFRAALAGRDDFQAGEELAQLYVDSLCRMQQWQQAAAWLTGALWEDSGIRARLLLRTVSDNFRINGLRPEAENIFSDNFTTAMAVNTFLDYLPEQKYVVVSCLLALYCIREEYLKALYLHQLYQSRAESGFTRLYTQIRKRLQDAGFGNVTGNYYSTIETAFYSLSSRQMLEFLKWAARIPLSADRAFHTFARFYDQLLERPDGKSQWEFFLNHLRKFPERNAWMIAVCSLMLWRITGALDAAETGAALDRAMVQADKPEDLPQALLAYAGEYIRGSGDAGICRRIISLLGKKGVHGRLIGTNRWYAGWEPEMSALREYCIEQYIRTGDEAFYTLPGTLQLELTGEELAGLAASSADKSMLFRQICRDYLEETDPARAVRLVRQEKWNNMGTRDSAAYEALRFLFQGDEDILQAQPLLENEEQVRRFRRDCLQILRFYPEKTGLFAFERSNFDTAYKLTVYSYLMACLYDEDIYDMYAMSYRQVREDEHLFQAMLRFLVAAYYAQIEWNQNFHFFYRRWRYLKIFLACLMSGGAAFDDSPIVQAMENNGHYGAVYEGTYLPFVENARRLYGSDRLGLDEKRYFCYGLMTGTLTDFMKDDRETFLNLPEPEADWMREMTAQLDYREAAFGLYRLMLDYPEEVSLDRAELAARAVSVYAQDLVRALKKRTGDEQVLQNFQALALRNRAAEVVRDAFDLDAGVFEDEADVLVPLICSRQFVFQIYDSIRSRMIHRSRRIRPAHYEKLTAYLLTRGEEKADSAAAYFKALQACMNRDAQAAAAAAAGKDIREGIPQLWKHEAEMILQYAQGKTDSFRHDTIGLDSSIGGEWKEISFPFVEELAGKYRLGRRRLSLSQAQELQDIFTDPAKNAQDRLKAGAGLLTGYPKIDRRSQDKSSLLPRTDLYLMLGLEAAAEGSGLSARLRLDILNQLYSGRNIFTKKQNRENAARLEEAVHSSFLRSPIALDDWVRHSGMIEEYLREKHMLLDFEQLRERILLPCGRLLQPGVSLENRYRELGELARDSKGLESAWSRSVFEALERERRQIENGVRLHVEIINEGGQVTDGFVYFLIENTGRCTVSLTDESYCVLLRQEGHPEREIRLDGMTDLMSGFLTGGRAELAADRDQTLKVSLSVIRKTEKAQQVISSQTAYLVAAAGQSPMKIGRRTRYEVSRAVTDSEKLFGREDLQADLEQIIPGGVTVIYGPSRIGKTSLMNWIRGSLARKRGNVLTVFFGGEGGMGKDSDYRKNFTDPAAPIPWDDDEKMSRYLLVDTAASSLSSMRRRFCGPASAAFGLETAREMLDILQDDSMSIIDRYYELEDLLAGNDLQLWLMLDEFQQVVEHWKPEVSCSFVSVCRMLAGEGEDGRIKLIVCGSDDLLRHMVLEDESVWRRAFPADARIAVEPLQEEDFARMIRQEKRLEGSGVTYAASALRTLYSYTGGVALYGKEICNAVLEEIETSPDKYRGRQVIYPSDISAAARRLLNQQAGELDTRAREGIREIYDAVTKNLRPDSDMQYLWYMARWIRQHPGQNGFPESVFLKNGRLRDEKELGDSLAIALARGIIRETGSAGSGRIFVFRTIFYYFAFLGSSAGNLDEERIFLPASAQEVQEDRPQALELIDEFGSLSGQDQMTVLSSIYHQKLDPRSREEFRDSIGSKYYGDTVQGSKIGTQNNVQVNVQSITNTLNGILSAGGDADKILEGIQALPRLRDYLPLAAPGQEGQEISEQRLERGISSYAEDMEEGVRASVEENGTRLADPAQILQLQPEEYDRLMEEYRIPDFFLESLQFAYQLQQIFTSRPFEQEPVTIDYSPVTIMYCKLVESMLKEYHIQPYGLSIPDVPTQLVNYQKRPARYTWREIRRLPLAQQQKLTIGSFVFPLVESSAVSHSQAGENIGDLAADTPGSVRDWKEHAEFIRQIKDIRNPSAHGNVNQRISRQQMEGIVKQMFDQGGFLRLIRIVREPL